MEKSFLKWAGGKYRLLPELIPAIHTLVDKKIKVQTFIEPFLGSGTVFLNVEGIDNFILNDSNQDLISLFALLKDDVDFIDKCSVYFKSTSNDREYFQNIVKKYNTVATTEQKAHMFLYLNKHCFNGLMRFNKKSFFNTPFGKYSTINFPQVALENMRDKLKNTNTSLLCRNFELILENSGFGDIVYCDPPYADLSEEISFKQYGKDVFTMEQQKQLAQSCFEAAQRGAKVIVSNHFTDFTKKIYNKCTSYKVLNVKRSISAKSDARKTVQEILAIYNF